MRKERESITPTLSLLPVLLAPHPIWNTGIMLTHVKEHSIHQQVFIKHPLCARPSDMLDAGIRHAKSRHVGVLSDQCWGLGDRPVCAEYFLHPSLLWAIGSRLASQGRPLLGVEQRGRVKVSGIIDRGTCAADRVGKNACQWTGGPVGTRGLTWLF